MKLECVKEKIKEAVFIVEKMTGRNLTLPILNTILFTVKNNTLTLRATNLDIGIEVSIPTKVLEEGVVAIPSTIISGVLSNINNDTNIQLKEKNNNTEITSQDNKVLIKNFPSDEFPTLPNISGGLKIVVQKEKLISGISSVIYSASLSDIKPEYASVYMEVRGENLVFVSTDTFRLAEKKIQIKNIKEFDGILIPFRNAIEIEKTFRNNDGPVDINFNKNQISFSRDNIYITSRLINGSFPDYTQIIPKEYKTEVVLLKQDLINALKVSNIFSDKFNQITLHISPKNNSCSISTKNPDIGESNISIDATMEGEEIEMRFNHRYINDGIQAIPGDSVVIKCAGADKPVVIQGVANTSFTYVVMPINK